MEPDEAEFRVANERIRAIAEELRKAELVRDRLDVDRAPEGVDEDIRVLTDAIQHPRAT